MSPQHRSHDFSYFEPERHDELSTGIRASEQAEAGQERTPDGRLVKGASTTPRKGGKARKGRTKLSHEIVALPVTERRKKQAKFMRRSTCAELARGVGEGWCGIIPSLFAKMATEDVALRETALEAGDIDMARKLGESARMHLLYARETCAKDAESRHKHGETSKNPHAELEAAVRAAKVGRQ